MPDAITLCLRLPGIFCSHEGRALYHRASVSYLWYMHIFPKVSFLSILPCSPIKGKPRATKAKRRPKKTESFPNGANNLSIRNSHDELIQMAQNIQSPSSFTTSRFKISRNNNSAQMDVPPPLPSHPIPSIGSTLTSISALLRQSHSIYHARRICPTHPHTHPRFQPAAGFKAIQLSVRRAERTPTSGIFCPVGF